MTPFDRARLLWTALALGCVFIALLPFSLRSAMEPVDDSLTLWATGAVVLLGGWSLIGVSILEGQWKPRCDSPSGLAKSYLTLVILRCAFAEGVLLISFVGFIVSGDVWLGLVAAPFTAVGFARASLNEQHLACDQQVVRDAGCGLSLAESLRAPVQ